MEQRTYKTRVSILLMIIIILAGVLCISPMILHHASKTAIILNSAFGIGNNDGRHHQYKICNIQRHVENIYFLLDS